MNPQLDTNLPEKSMKNLDGATAKAFEAIRAKGFEPFLVSGPSSSAIMAVSLSGSEGNITIPLGGRRKDYVVVLVASNPQYVFEKIRDESLVEEVIKMVPSEMKGTKIGEVIVHDYNGEKIRTYGTL